MTPPAENREWSLVRHWTLLVTACITVVVVVQSGLVAYIVRDALDRELDALFLEEVAELRYDFSEAPVTAQEVKRITAYLERIHPEESIGVRVWRAPFVEPFATAGSISHERWPARPLAVDGFEVLGKPWLRSGATRFEANFGAEGEGAAEEPVQVDLLIDASERWKQLSRSGWLLCGVAALGGVAAVGAGLLLARRLKRLLADVEASARSAELDDTVALEPPPAAPREISAVVRALGDSIAHMREQHARSVLMTAGLAHELRSPLQNLITTAEVALLSDRATEEYRGILEDQLDELRALALVVDNLITLTALRDRKRLARGARFQLDDEVRLRLSREEDEARRRDVTLRIEAHGDCALVGDREALVLMIRNLVSNALTWTPNGTEVLVELEGGLDVVVVRVSDEGPGVRPEEREAIFEAFHQGSAPRERRAGYGLGLALARAAVRSAGGEIHIEDAPGGGARFVAELPRRSAA